MVAAWACNAQSGGLRKNGDVVVVVLVIRDRNDFYLVWVQKDGVVLVMQWNGALHVSLPVVVYRLLSSLLGQQL